MQKLDFKHTIFYREISLTLRVINSHNIFEIF